MSSPWPCPSGRRSGRPGPGGRGDYATNVALQLARPAGRPPHEVAEILRPHLSGVAGVAHVEITAPGFLNITVSGRGQALVAEILRLGDRYGYAAAPTGELVQLHHPCEARAAVTGQVLARILRSQGALVRTSCEAEPDPAWAGPLGVTVDAHGRPGAPAPLDVNLRPVPAVPVGQDPALLTALGRDAARWALLHPAPHDRPRVTEEHLVQREGNPLFRVRYAYARSRALSRNAAHLGFTSAPAHTEVDTEVETGTGVPHAHAHAVSELLGVLDAYPHALASAARHRGPDRLARHLVAVADATLAFQHTVLPVGDEKPSAAHRTRLALAEAAGTVLAGGLSLLGIDAPEHL
ncbi:arginyl-tRNA synthetase [Streptomyces aurantiacus]|nr:arginyl-tRNA synthetase [Streptomyces aurantiacus]